MYNSHAAENNERVVEWLQDLSPEARKLLRVVRFETLFEPTWEANARRLLRARRHCVEWYGLEVVHVRLQNWVSG